jgi:hypothetical protein
VQHAAALTPVSAATHQADMIAGLVPQHLKDPNAAGHASDDDPWRLFPNGDYVHWQAIVRDRHRAIR